MERAIAQLTERGEGRCALSGALTLETVPWVWQQLRSGPYLEGAVHADLEGVDDADSAGLALVVAWRASCEAHGGRLQLRAVPRRLLALARLTGAEALLDAAD